MINYSHIDNIRETRIKISKEHDDDTRKLIKHYKELEQLTKRKLFQKELMHDKVA